MKTHLTFDAGNLYVLSPISLGALPHISVGLSAIDCLREPATIPLLCSRC